jgi:hypothetical protein
MMKRLSYRKNPLRGESLWVLNVGTASVAHGLYAREPTIQVANIVSLQFTPLFLPCGDDLNFPVPIVVSTGIYPPLCVGI